MMALQSLQASTLRRLPSAIIAARIMIGPTTQPTHGTKRTKAKPSSNASNVNSCAPPLGGSLFFPTGPLQCGQVICCRINFIISYAVQ